MQILFLKDGYFTNRPVKHPYLYATALAENSSNKYIVTGFNHLARLHSRAPVGLKSAHYWLNNRLKEEIASDDQHLIHRHNSVAETPLFLPLSLLI